MIQVSAFQVVSPPLDRKLCIPLYSRQLILLAWLLSLSTGWLCRPFGECLHFIQHYEHSCILNSQSNVMLGVHSSLAMW